MCHTPLNFPQPVFCVGVSSERSYSPAFALSTVFPTSYSIQILPWCQGWDSTPPVVWRGMPLPCGQHIKNGRAARMASEDGSYLPNISSFREGSCLEELTLLYLLGTLLPEEPRWHIQLATPASLQSAAAVVELWGSSIHKQHV